MLNDLGFELDDATVREAGLGDVGGAPDLHI